MKTTIFTVLMMLGTYAAASGDDGLYDDIAPPGSAFIRVINTGSTALSAIAINDYNLDNIDACNASSYAFFPAGNTVIQTGGKKNTFLLEKDKFYSVAIGDKYTLIEDTYYKNRRKSLAVVYSFLPGKTIDITVNEGKVSVFKNIAYGQRVEREINAVSIAMDVNAGDIVVPTDKQSFTRGDVFSLLVCGSSQKANASWVKWSVVAPE